MKTGRIVVPAPPRKFDNEIKQNLARRQELSNREPKKQSLTMIIVDLRALQLTIERQARS